MILLFLSVLSVFPGMMGDTIGYRGKSVTLSSGAKPPGNISKIVWSIFINNTWIATYEDGELNTEWFWQFKGRLQLNNLSGDLEIQDLNKTDEMEYTVLIKYTMEQYINKVKLIVTEVLPRPRIRKVFSVLKNGLCVMNLQCSSSVKDINLSLEPESSFNGSFWSRTSNTRTSELWTSYRPNRNVTFTCTASSVYSYSSSSEQERCQEEVPKTVVSKTTRAPFIGCAMVFLGIVFGVVLTTLRFPIKWSILNCCIK
ncbi:uncharacterized protein LOC117593932 isoform X1 [Esox lucius]|uniref:Ig-like domain-containing protein n=1 Tax=Esox lucius TaxID=8010 RepID=A0AAY5L9H2_ESOLU|nr:uncharacterized protein LOC117593932 isoform X1 [Esox lucius]